MKRNLALILLTGSLLQSAHALNPGDIAFTGFNADGNDNLAFVALAPIPSGTVIYFTDEEWNGTAWATNTEAAWTWTATENIAAGVVVTIDNVNGLFTPANPTISNLGTITAIVDVANTNNAGFAGSDEAVFAYESDGTLDANGVPKATGNFLAVIANEDAAGSGISLTGTGLSEAAGTAILFTLDEDGMAYTGSRAGQTAFADYLLLLADKTTNWTTQAGDGTLLLPFSLTPFSEGALSNTLTLSISPATFSESATNPASTGTITRSDVTASDLVVTLTSPDTTEVTVPATVTILANQASATFDVTAVNDTLPDGNKVVTLNATAPSSTAGTFDVTVQDDGDTLPATALQVGDIAFTTFNGDRDAIAFVALDTIPAGEVIHFTDSAWDGSAVDGADHFAPGEANVSWTAPVGGIAPGTVVVIDSYDTAPTASVGSATGGSGISSSSETIYAYQGFAVRQPITFLAAISNSTLENIVNTGLTSGSTALQVLPTGTDQAEYTGSRANQTAIVDYIPLIGNVATNWTGGGEGDFAGTSPNGAAFTLFTPGSAIVDIVATASTAEGNSGNTSLTLAVSRTADTTAFTVDYAVTGGTATSGTDFTALASGTLTFAVGGALSQNITLDILGDTVIESNETVIITLSNLVQVTGTAALGNVTGTGTITNDDSAPVSFPASGAITSTLKSSILLGGSEIPAFDPASKRAFASSAVGIQVVNLTDAAAPVQLTTIAPSALGVSGLTSNDVSSITVRKGTGGNPSILAAAIINSPTTSNGHVVFLNAATGALIGSAVVGAVPDHIAFTPDGTKLLVCNEGELAGSSATIPDAAMGTVSIIVVDSAGLPGVVQTADFSAFDATATITSLKAAGVRFFGAGVPSTDFEPEYLAISPDGTKAMVTLQEANAVAILDITTATFTSVVALGEKDFSTGRHDFSDRDGAGGASGIVYPTTGNPVFGLYMPDAIASYQVGGQTYYVTANEGDDRNDFIEPNETTTVSNASYDLDDATFPTEATLKTNSSLGRLTVSNATGLRGDTDGDGDIDKILSYGGRSFSILDSTGARIFDSGDMLEMIVASQFSAQFDDGRSDNKGPEPEGVIVAKIGARTFAFVGLERSHMVLAFDVTNPLSPTFATAFQRTGDLNPEGMVVVEAADSPSGKPLLIVSSESSNTLTIFEIGQPTDFQLQLLHLADAEAGLLASSTAPNLAALVDAFDGTFPNTLILAGGDNYIPGPFAAAGTDALVAATHTRGNNPFAADIEIHNRLGVEASTVGNHEFDFGTNAFSDAINDTEFPYLSSNLDFSGDTGISARYQETVGAGLEEATSVKKKIVPSCVVTKGTEKIGLVGVTTQILESISSTGGVEVKGFAVDGSETNNMALLASQVQPVINDLISQGVDKIVLMAHLQQINFEQTLAPLLNGVDIILAAGSNTRLGDSNDVSVAFTGHAADFAGNYPIYTAGADGLPIVIVNTDNEFTYLGRLVADFDADGVLIVPNLLANTAVNGAYAATAANAAAAWGVAEVDLLSSAAFSPGSKGALVKQITDAVQGVITVKDGAIRGYTDVYLEGERNFVRNQETNLGDISADSMIAVGQIALPSATHMVAMKNGGGIRAAIGAVDVVSGAKLPPIANPSASKPAGAISLLDIENSMRFNNGLMLCDTTPAGLKAILEHGVFNAGTGNGRFPQIGGIRFSYDSAATAGSRIQSIVLTDENDNITGRVVSGGVIRADAPATITLVTLNFLANGGDSYPFKANADNFRFLLTNGTLSASIDESLSFTAAEVVPSNILGEQLTLANYLLDRHATPTTAYDIAETVPELDTRIQSIAVRTDNVLAGPATFPAWLAANGFTSTGIDTDSDSDGLTDRVEFFFNLNPNAGGDFANLPQMVPNGGAQELDYTLLNNAANIEGDLQVSGDLVTWSPALSGVDFTLASSVVNGDETSTTYALPGSGPSVAGVSATYSTPNTSDPVGATLGGVRIVNEGLVGVGRISGNNLDQFNETQGAASGLFITDWAWNGSQFTGTFQVLPDRGFNAGTIFSNYAARLHEVDFTFEPYYGAGPVAQGQINPTYVSSTKFTYEDEGKIKFTTGLDVTGTGSLFGDSVGVATAANGPGGTQESLLSFDAEAVHLFNDGSGYVSDEYGTYIARFNPAKRITNITQLPESARPHNPVGVSNFSSTVTPSNGRRQNQGLEGMSVTPDGTRLFAVMQSALVQDTNGTSQQTRNNTRLYVYDVAGAKRENPELIGQYVVKLPQLNSSGNGSAPNRAAAQSEIVALNGTSFLMLPRDGNGLGTGSTAPIVFKSVQLVDFASATNILGTYDAEGAAVSPAGVLAPGVNAAAAAEIINMLEPTDLAKFGLNKNAAAPDANTLNEKMEGMALVPDLSTPQANDFFLFLANDNDFQSSDVKMIDATGNLVSYGDGRSDAGNGLITNDAMFYAYRVTIDANGKKFFRFEIE
jgi:2',3'-cyclic-nucleotide 2'-phosphodiesterase (5'-nucleotidase family)